MNLKQAWGGPVTMWSERHRVVDRTAADAAADVEVPPSRTSHWMHEVPPLADVADAPDVLTGHLWLQELVDGSPLRFQVRTAAPIRFGDDRREFDADDVPRPLRYAVHEVQRDLDRAALRNAVENVETITFVGVATHRRRVDYDWAHLPGFLGTDVWEDDTDEFLPPDRAEQVFSSLGLTPLNALAKEVRAADFQPQRYEFPDSNWRDGPVAGVVVRNKTGGRARLPNPDVLASADERPGDSTGDESAEALAVEFATLDRFQRAAATLKDEYGATPGFDALQERVLDGIYREFTPAFEHAAVDHDAFRRAVAERTSEYLGSR